MFKRALQVLLALMALIVLCVGFFCFGVIWHYVHLNSNDVQLDPLPTVTSTVAPTPEATATVVAVPTNTPKVSDNVEAILLYVDDSGFLFAFEEKYVDSVNRVVNVNKTASLLKLKEGRVEDPNFAWIANDFTVRATVDSVEVKNRELYTTAFEIVESTVMESRLGFAHRLLEEGKKKEHVATLNIHLKNNEYSLEVWYQNGEYALRVYGKDKAEYLPTATPRIPTDDPTATPRIPMDDPTATPRIPMDDPTATPRIPMDDPTATPRIPTNTTTVTPTVTATPRIPVGNPTATPKLSTTSPTPLIPMDDIDATPNIDNKDIDLGL